MKKIFSLIAMCLMAMSMMAQSTVATLTNGRVTTCYYGTTAFDYALRNAQDGGFITLSGGHFVLESGSEFIIDKELTIRGNGMEGTEPTIIENKVTIRHNANEKLNLNIEGIKFAANVQVMNQPDANTPYVVDGVTFKKCSIAAITTRPLTNKDWYGTFKNLALINCKCNYVEVFNEASISIINSIILNRVMSNKSGNFTNNVSITSDHSVFLMPGIYPNELVKGEFNNCILAFQWGGTYSEGKIGNLVTLRNCLVTAGSMNYPEILFVNCHSENCAYVSNLFKTCTNFTAITDDTYELTDEAKAYLSTDGETERGIYGGTVSYSPIVSYPCITTLEVAEKADGGVLPIYIRIE